MFFLPDPETERPVAAIKSPAEMWDVFPRRDTYLRFSNIAVWFMGMIPDFACSVDRFFQDACSSKAIFTFPGGWAWNPFRAAMANHFSEKAYLVLWRPVATLCVSRVSLDGSRPRLLYLADSRLACERSSTACTRHRRGCFPAGFRQK